MGKSSKRETKTARQVAALPIAEHEGETYVLLVTSRETGRWVLPKGWTEKNRPGCEVALKEAWEEAGVVGTVRPERVGVYHYVKRLPKGRSVESRVEVFPVVVQRLAETWPEKGQRLREWFTFAQAAMVVDEAELVTMLLRLAAPR